MSAYDADVVLGTVHVVYFIGDDRINSEDIMMCESWLEAEAIAKAHADKHYVAGIDGIMLAISCYECYVDTMLEKKDGEWVRTFSENLDTLGILYDGGDE